MIQAEKIHFEMLSGIYGLISPDQRLKARRLTAVNVSTAYTAMEIARETQRYPYAKYLKQEVEWKSLRLCHQLVRISPATETTCDKIPFLLRADIRLSHSARTTHCMCKFELKFVRSWPCLDDLKHLARTEGGGWRVECLKDCWWPVYGT